MNPRFAPVVFRGSCLAALLAVALFAVGAASGTFPPFLAQALLTAVSLAVGGGIVSALLCDPAPRRGLGPLGLASVAASQAAFLALVWTDVKQDATLWRIWWGTAVPSLVAAHLRVLRLWGIRWDSPFGRAAAAAILAHGLGWVLLVCRADILADPPAWFAGVLVVSGAGGALATVVQGARHRIARTAVPPAWPLWARWVAAAAAGAALFCAGLYLGRVTGQEEAVFDLLPSALAGIPPAELEGQVRADAARLAGLAAGIEESSGRLPELRRRIEGGMKASGRVAMLAPEDDDLRAAWMTFLTYRSGLLRLAAVYSGFESVRDPDLRARCFLVAHAAATLLFESSGHLVVTFQDWDEGRRKLNEPDPRWGIAAGMFDRIAAGVAAERNAERFEEMAAYFEDRLPLWKERAVWDPETMGWFEGRVRRGIEAVRTADVHRHRNWLRRVVDRVRSDAYTPVYAVQSQVSVWIGDTRVVSRPPLIAEAQIEELRGKLQPGDIILERRNFFLSNAFLPGFWPHAALYVGEERELASLGVLDHPDVRAKLEAYRKPAADGHRHAVIEAVSEGVVFNSLEHSTHADYVAILRPRATPEQRAAAIARAFANQGKPYDFEFDFRTSHRLVCTEVVYRSYEGIVTFGLHRVMGRDTLPAVEIVRKFRRELGTPGQELEFVAFLDGRPEEGRAEWSGVEAFCASAERSREFEE